jgi:hypothetical protein
MSISFTYIRAACALGGAALASSALAQTPTHWFDHFDGGIGQSDVVRAVAHGPNGTVSSGGNAAESLRVASIATTRYDAQGHRLWTRIYRNTPDSSGFHNEAVAAIGADAAGNTYTLGESWSGLRPEGGEFDYVLIKYSPTGDELWVRRFNGPGNWSDTPTGMKVDAAGNCYISGFAFFQPDLRGRYATDFHVIKYTTSGDIAWQYHTNNADSGNLGAGARSIALDPAGNVYATGVINSGDEFNGNNDFLTVKLTNDGQLVYRAVYSSPGGNTGQDDGQVVAADSAGNAYVAGYWMPQDSTVRHLDTRTLKYSATGTLLWTISTSRQGEERAHGIDVDTAGNVYVGGVWFDPTENNGWLESYSPSGAPRWATVVDESGTFDENAVVGLKVGTDGNLYVGADNQRPGPTGYDPTLLKIAPSGHVLLRLPIDAGSTSDSCFAFDLDPQNNAYLGGHSYFPATSADFLVIKVFGDTPCAPDYNHDSTLNSQDLFDFLGAFLSNNPAADFNADRAVNSQDLFDFLGAFFAGC